MNTHYKVEKTNDYSKFALMTGNRPINKAHFNKLKKSISEESLIVPIIVNERYEIIDGQNRFHAWLELGLPVYYIVAEGYGLEQVQRLNSNVKNWSNDDYMDCYCQLNNVEYLKYRKFKLTYELGHYESLAMLTGHYKGSGLNFERFRLGTFKIKNYKKACEMAEKVILIQPFYDGYKRRSFVLAMLLLINNPAFEMGRLLQKLKFQQAKLFHCTTKQQYLVILQDIYNYKTSDKVNLIYT
tara:strand:+ start:828 stop:1550 length:723 start_codon:yes stop_codon:yes gene_type:complete